MQGFNPGTSPPPVRIPIFTCCFLLPVRYEILPRENLAGRDRFCRSDPRIRHTVVHVEASVFTLVYRGWKHDVWHDAVLLALLLGLEHRLRRPIEDSGRPLGVQ